MSTNRRDFLERSAMLAALGFTPRSISVEEWEAERMMTSVPAAGFGRGPVWWGPRTGFTPIGRRA